MDAVRASIWGSWIRTVSVGARSQQGRLHGCRAAEARVPPHAAWLSDRGGAWTQGYSRHTPDIKGSAPAANLALPQLSHGLFLSPCFPGPLCLQAQMVDIWVSARLQPLQGKWPQQIPNTAALTSISTSPVTGRRPHVSTARQPRAPSQLRMDGQGSLRS